MAPGSLEPEVLPDETSPLLQNERRNSRDCDASSKNIVVFDPNGDSDNPLDWPDSYKWSVVALLALTAFTVYVANQIPRSFVFIVKSSRNGAHY